MILEKGRQCHITKQLVHSFSVNIRISQPSKVMSTSASPRWTSLRLGGHQCRGLTNPDVNRKRMHQLYNVAKKYSMASKMAVIHTKFKIGGYV